jgi:hypothetical protein
VRHDDILFHNVATMARVADHDGRRLRRIPDDVREQLNEGAQDKYQRAAGMELRFASEDDSVDITLSSPVGPCRVVPFWGPFRGTPRTVEQSPTTLTLDRPARVVECDPAAVDSAIDPRCWRLRLCWTPGPIHYHGVTGAVAPPPAEWLPDRRYLAYGTSITQGNAAGMDHLTYVARTARLLGVDAINLGTGGSAYCERAIADYIAAREDWTIGTFALSVNMCNADFSLATFRDRTRYLLDTVAGADPDRRVLAITLFPFAADLGVGPTDPARATAFRETLHEVVADLDHPNLEIVDGPALLSPAGLTADCLHPGEDGMVEIADRLAARLA